MTVGDEALLSVPSSTGMCKLDENRELTATHWDGDRKSVTKQATLMRAFIFR